MAGLTELFEMDFKEPHSALGDARALKELCTRCENLVFGNFERVTLQDLLQSAWDRLPLSLANVFKLSSET